MNKIIPIMTDKEQSKIIFNAIEFAAKAHSGQFRKGTKVPYIVHPLGVAKTLIELNCSGEIIVAGILHDIVEDTHFTTEDIRNSFGEKVAELVESASEPDKSDSWENRKKHTIDYLKTAPIDTLLITCADKLDNIKSTREDYEKLGESVWSRFDRPKKDQGWYYNSLVSVLESRISGEPGLYLVKQLKLEVQKVF